MKETVYLAGKITGDPHYRTKFYAAAHELEAAGFIVVNPAMLPAEGFTWEAYMRMTTPMLDECAAACFLPDWKESCGAQEEYKRAERAGKRIFMFDVWENEKNRHAAPLFCKVSTRIFGISPSALAKCTIGKRHGCEKCKNCECNTWEAMQYGFTAGLYERRGNHAEE